jgi:predicted esterase
VDSPDVLITNVAATTHGRVLSRPVPAAAGALVGFHGYYENAEIQMARLAAIPDTDEWTLVSVQGLHRFYRARTNDVVASWMTRQDRELAIGDNIAYVDAALASVVGAPPPGLLVCAGFSQGVAMAFRAALRGRRRADAIVAVGGDVPPELLADPGVRFPRVLVIRGAHDEYFPQTMFDDNVAALRARGADVTTMVVECAHDWTADVSTAAGEFLRRVLTR